MLLLVLAACGGTEATNASPSLFLFQTRDADGGVPLLSASPDTPLYLQPDDPDLIEGHAGPLLSADRARTLTLGEWLRAKGKVHVTCANGQAQITVSLQDLVPGGLYTVWVLAITVPLMYDDRRIPTFFATRNFVDTRYIIYLGPAGAGDGSDSILHAGADGSAELSTTMNVVLAPGFECVVSTPNWFVLLDYHPDGRTFGPLARPEAGSSEQAAHLGFAFKKEEALAIPPP